MKKIIKIVSISLLVILLTGCNNKLAGENKKLEDEKKQIMELHGVLQNDYNLLLEQYNALKYPDIPPVVDNKSCSIIRTYRVIKVMNDYQDETNTRVFLIVDVFQNHVPFVLAIPKEMALLVKENKSYEFTIEGNKNELLSSKFLDNPYKVIKILQTDKIGLEQTSSNNCN